MIAPDHECWWTSHHTSELTWRDEHIVGYGICLSALHHAAQKLGVALLATPAPEDEYGLDLTLGTLRGSLHDGCMPRFEHPNAEHITAIVGAMLEHHAAYLRTDSVPSQVSDYLTQTLRVDTTVRVATDARDKSIVVRSYAADASVLGRFMTPRRRFVCD